jgi:hypothetical protein
MKAKKNKRQPSRANETGQRRTARPPGDDAMEKEHPQATWAEIDAAMVA